MAWLYTVSGFHLIAKYLSGMAPGIPWNISRDALMCGASHQEVSIFSESPSVFTEMRVLMLSISPDRILAPVSRARRWLAGGDITGVTTLQSTSQGIFHKTLIISWAQRSGEGLLPSEYATADECSQAQCSLSTQGYYSTASPGDMRLGLGRSSQPGGWGQEVRDDNDNVITVPVHWQFLMSSVVRNY